MIDTQNKLYDTAIKYLGRDVTPADKVRDEVACAECVWAIVNEAFPEKKIPKMIGTADWARYMQKSPSFEQIQEPEKGAIIVAVTGTGNFIHGHIGIVGKNTSEDGTLWVMSNDSRNGFWTANYTVNTWNRYYQDKGKMSVLLFRVV